MKFSKQRTVNRVVLLDVNEITSSPYQPRRQFDPKGMKELADSISQSGLLQPITVRRTETGYELIAGERRLMACRMLHLDKIPAIQQLMQRCEMTQQQVAERLGKAQSTVANKLRLLTFSEPLRRRMLDAGLTERHARALLKLPDEITVAAALEHIVRERLNVGETERYVDALLEPVEEQEEPRRATRLFIVKDLRVFMNTISKAVSTMKLAGIDINTTKVEDEEYICYTMRIPKKSAYRTHSA